MSILEELYNGNIHVSEKGIKNGGEYKKINAKLTDQLDKFISKLNDEEKELFEQIENLRANINYISEKEDFIEGFSMGAKMMLEVLYFKSENFTAI